MVGPTITPLVTCLGAGIPPTWVQGYHLPVKVQVREGSSHRIDIEHVGYRRMNRILTHYS
jgi:hypothetical protein